MGHFPLYIFENILMGHFPFFLYGTFSFIGHFHGTPYDYTCKTFVLLVSYRYNSAIHKAHFKRWIKTSKTLSQFYYYYYYTTAIYTHGIYIWSIGREPVFCSARSKILPLFTWLTLVVWLVEHKSPLELLRGS